MGSLKNVSEYLRRNINRVLLIGVILSFCMAMRFTAIGKYFSYIENATQVVADDFCFESNYLSAVSLEEAILDPRPINWLADENKTDEDREDDVSVAVISIDMRNYNNALRYNKNCDLFYYLEAEWYTNQACTAKNGLDTQYPGLEIEITETYSNEGYDKRYLTSSSPAAVQHLGYIAKGSALTETVTLKLKANYKIDGEQIFVVVKAHSLSDSADITFEEGSASDYSTVGCYESEILSVFGIGNVGSYANITTSMFQMDSALSYCVLIKCDSLENQGSVNVLLFYEDAKIRPSESDIQTFDVSSVDLTRCEWKPMVGMEDKSFDADKHDKYIQATVNSGSTTDVYFLARSMGDYYDGCVVAAVLNNTAE